MKPAKTSTKHPYAAIEHRVIDSPAYASLTFSARALLVLLTRQLSKDNNGHLQATYSYMRRFGFDSERTISRCVKELVATGLICRTRCGGYQQGASQYAVTWLPIKNRQGLFLDGFQSCAWRDWVPTDKKIPPAKMQTMNIYHVGVVFQGVLGWYRQVFTGCMLLAAGWNLVRGCHARGAKERPTGSRCTAGSFAGTGNRILPLHGANG